MLATLQPSPAIRPWLVVLSVTGATILPTYLNGALTVALPTIGAKIGLSSSELQWPLTVMALVNGAFLLVSGGLADANGRRYIFLAGTAWIMVFSIPLAIIQDAPAFIGMSAVLGFGAALLAPAATGILSESLPDGKFKNGSFACLGAGQPLGFILGLIIGGVFAKQQYAIYAIVAAAAGLFAFTAVLVLPRDGERLQVPAGGSSSEDDQSYQSAPRAPGSLLLFDWTGAGLSTAGIVLLTLGLAFASSQSRGWRSLPVLLCLPLSVVLMTVFFVWEWYKQRQSSSYEEGQTQRALRAPLIPPGVWKAPRFSSTLVCVFLAWLSFNALTYHCTLMYQEIQQTSPIQTSIRFLPMVGAGLLLNVAGGVLVARINALWLMLAGCIGGAASCLIFALLDPSWPYARALLWVMILTVSPDVFFPAAQLFVCQTVGPRRAALAGSLFNITVRLATSIGLALTSSIATTITNQYADTLSRPEALLRGYRAAGWFCFGASSLASVMAVIYLRDVGVVGIRQTESRLLGEDDSQQIPLESMESEAPIPQVYRRGKADNEPQATTLNGRAARKVSLKE